MKKLIFIFGFLFITSVYAQETTKKSNLEFHFNGSKHGTGDMFGYLYGINYQQSFGKKIYWVFGFEGTFHDNPNGDILRFDYHGRQINSDIRFVIAGMQLVGGIKYNFLESTRHNIGISVLPILRYQANSMSDEISTEYPILTGVPYPVRTLVNEEPARTFAVGGVIRLHYNYIFGKNFYTGLQAGFQTDTNGDAILQGGLKFGKTFNW